MSGKRGIAAVIGAALALQLASSAPASAAEPSAPAAPAAHAAPVTDAVPLAQLARAPTTMLRGGGITARIYLPDAQRGFYRGTRFDWAGVIGSLTYQGHDYYVPWFAAMSPTVRDFVYQDGAVIASANTAATGPVEEFNAPGGALGFADAAPGGLFLKIGVGVLRRPDDAAYSSFRLYPLVDGGRRTQHLSGDRAEFTQEVGDPGTGYAYRYTKRLRLEKNQPILVIEHTLRNTGHKTITTMVYDHNFLDIDGRGAPASLAVTTPFALATDAAPDPALAEIKGTQFLYHSVPPIEGRIMARLTGFGTDAADYDFRIVDREHNAAVRITADQPVAQLALWSIRSVMAIEPFVKMSIEPGATFRWTYRYAFGEQ
jgi:hypothetical protein